MAKRKESAPVLDMVVGQDPELVAANVDGRAVVEWLHGLTEFFRQATALEVAAKSQLEAARLLKVPASAAEDVALQRFVKQTTEDRKALEAHWGVTSFVHRLHRRLTARRDVGTKALEEANAIGNRLHTQFVDQAKRKAAEEERRQREEAEFLARQERQQELDRMEQEATQAEEGSPELSKREAEFVELYCGTNTNYRERAQACAVAAGFGGNTTPGAIKAAARLMSSAKIQMAIKLKTQAASIRRQRDAVAEKPIVYESVEVKPDISKAAGASDRTTWSGEVLNERALLTAFLGCAPEDYQNKFGIPADVWKLDPVALNRYARSLKSNMDRWPGVRAKSSTAVI